MINEMTQDACREVMNRASVGRLGCSRDGQPYVVPICLAYEADYLYLFSTLGRKIEWMRANPKVCVQIEEIGSQSDWISVIAYGKYQELPESQSTPERVHARQLLASRAQWWLNALAERRIRSADQLIAPLFFRIHIDSITGLCATNKN